MRGRILAGSIMVLGLLAPAPTPAPAADCNDKPCGLPNCWEPRVHARPGMTREVQVSCWNATGAKLLTPPAHSEISAVSADWYGVKFTIRPAQDAPRTEQATFEVAGPEGSVEVTVDVNVIPIAENSAPVCEGDRKSQRSDGSGPVDVFLHPYCRDPDFDDFVMHGGGPGAHSMAPKQVPSGHGESNWAYRTATHAGKETGTVWAVDSLGARSADATLEVEVGPGIDRLPDCLPGSGDSTNWGVIPISTRPGAIRRFGVMCDDPDGDPFAATLSSLPSRGVMTMAPANVSETPYWGFEMWNDLTYVPKDDSLEPDPFSVTATGARGSGPQARYEMVPRPLPYNGGGGCGWGPLSVAPDTAGAISITCYDDEGDPLSAQVVGGPLHGAAGPPVLLPDITGSTRITIPYTPEPGYEGYDCVKVTISDGNGLTTELSIDINVSKPIDYGPPPAAPFPIPLPPFQGGFPPHHTLGPPPSRTAMVKSAAADVLGTQDVRRLASPPETFVYAAKRLSRRQLLRERKAPAVFVICPRTCGIGAASRLMTGSRARGMRRSTAAQGSPGQGQLLWMELDPAQRRTLRRASRAKAAFKVSVRQDAAARSTRHEIPIAK